VFQSPGLILCNDYTKRTGEAASLVGMKRNQSAFSEASRVNIWRLCGLYF
jgi:hypothetical protein